MARSTPHDERAEEAAECFLCLNDLDADSRVRARWSAWLSADPANREAYHRVRDAWSRPVPSDVWPTHDEILADTSDGEGPLLAPAAKHRVSFATLSLATVAAVLLAAVVGLWAFDRPGPPAVGWQAYRTARGEQRRIALPDGSSIALGPSSVLFLEGKGPGGEDGGGAFVSGRAARLEAGEAVFSIVHDAAHPFSVAANGGRIDDVGTAFGVAVGQGRATVTVVEGAVQVVGRSGRETVSLSGDQQVSFAGRLEPVRAVDGRAATEWVRGRLVYVDRPLGEVVADLSRYTTLDIDVADSAVAQLRYTGTIETDAIDHWVAALTKVFPVRAEREGARLVLRVRAERLIGRAFFEKIFLTGCSKPISVRLSSRPAAEPLRPRLFCGDRSTRHDPAPARVAS
jgi:transmembrane sensor